MNKKFIFAAAICAAMSMGAYADETNLAQGKTATASTGNASLAVDGNLESRWEVNAEDENETTDLANDYTVTKGHWLYVDLGEAKTFNTLRIKWQAAYAKEFKVLVADDKDNSGEPNWKESAILSKAETLTDFTKNYTYFLENAVTARYVKIQAVKLGYNGNWFSMFELGIYNLTAEEKVSKITTIKADKETVNPGGEFTISATDQFDNDMTSDLTYTCENATQEGTSNKFKANAAGTIKITAKDTNGNEKTVELEAYTPEMTTAEAIPGIVVKGVETPLSFIVKDQKGEAITDFTTSVTDDKITAKTDGEQDITVTYGGTTKTVKVYAVSTSKDTPAEADYDADIFFGDENGVTVADKAWNEKYSNCDIVEINGNKMWRVSNVGSFGFIKGSIAGTDYKTLSFDIFSTTDVENAYVQMERAGEDFAKLPFKIKGGEWNHISLDVEGASKFNDYIQLYLGKADATNNPSILLDNVCLSKAPIKDFVCGNADENGIVPVKGTISADNVDKLKEIDGTAFNFAKVKFADGYTPAKIEMKNPNAIIVVPGTTAAIEGTANDKVGTATANWGDTKNLVVQDTYFYPVKQLEITDKYPVFRDYFISAGKTGYKYTRSLSAKTYSTVFLPIAAEVPTGCTAYELSVDATDDNTIILKKVETLEAKVPYIIYNGKDAETNLVMVSTEGDMNFQAADVEKEVGNLVLHGTYNYFNGDGSTQYGIQDEKGENNKLSLKKIGTNAIVSPFRVYFTVKEGTIAHAIGFDFGGTTGIQHITNAINKAKDGNIYSIDGKLVKTQATGTEGLAKGVYIINGKKVIVK